MSFAKSLPLLALLLPAVGACARPSPARICGDVLDEDGRPVADAAVTAGGTEARTDRFGRFCLDGVRPGTEVRAEADATCPGPATPPGAGWIRIVSPRRLSVDSHYQVGFGADVELRASLRCPLPGPVTYRWDQLEGPPAEAPTGGGSPPSAAGLTYRFRTARLATRTVRPDVLAISPRRSGRYLFRVTASGGGRVVRAEAEVTAASITAGLLSVPIDTFAYVDSGAARPAGVWRVATRPEGSDAEVEPVATIDGAAGVVRARLDRVGLYELVDDRSGTRVLFEAGPWDTVPRDCDRPDCHPREEEQ
jgi:hypothetical protein